MKHIQNREEYQKMNESNNFDINNVMDLEKKVMDKIYTLPNSENLGSGYRDNNGHVIPVALKKVKVALIVNVSVLGTSLSIFVELKSGNQFY